MNPSEPRRAALTPALAGLAAICTTLFVSVPLQAQAADIKTLTITVSGNGLVDRNPDLIGYPQGSLVVLTAIPAAHNHFVRWGGDVTASNNPLNLTMDSDKSITATFVIDQHLVIVTTVGNGSVTKTPNLPSYPYGTLVRLTAIPDAGYRFLGWSGDTTTNTNPLDIVVTKDKSFTATFVLNGFRLALHTVGLGSITAEPAQPAYLPGTVVKLTAVPAMGYHFWFWAGDATGSINPINVTMNKNRNVTAYFMANTTPLRVPDGFSSQYLVRGLQEPVGMAFLPDGRLLCVERATGWIRMVVAGALATVDPVGVVDSVQSAEPERGLLGIAVDPDWPQRPYLYTYYTAVGGSIRLSRFEAQGDLDNSSSGNLSINAASRYDVLRDLPDAAEFHNGGTLRFGLDHMLYLAPGDDADDCAAQDLTSLKGAMLRIDVSALPPGPGGPPDRFDLAAAGNPFVGSTNANERLVWANGLRNPFRFHIDSQTGDVFIGDVGLSTYEEIDRVAAQGLDLGWPIFEGLLDNPGICGSGIVPTALEPPIYAYNRTGVPAAVIGAGVYRFSACAICNFPLEYDGDYFFSDFFQGFLRRLKVDNGVWSIAKPVAGQPDSIDWGLGFEEIADYLVGPDGALWYCRMSTNSQTGTGEIGRVFHKTSVLGAPVEAAQGVAFAAPYPSPSHGRVNFAYALPASQRVALSIFDLMGRRVRGLVPDGVQAPGMHRVTWDGRTENGAAASPGLYLARLVVDDRTFVRRVAIAR